VSIAFTGAVLVGGRSARMGFDKSTLFVDRITEVLRDAGADEVLLIREDDRPGNGPLGGIATALRRAVHDVVVVLACDLPDVHVEGIRLVVDGLGSADVALPPGSRCTPCGGGRRCRRSTPPSTPGPWR
jgi:molybdopterin-guanine dinucleotide biosynthesis protein A